MRMFERLVPQRADNTSHGHKLALWLFAVVVIVKSIMSLGSIFNGRVTATSADGIPLDAYTPAGAQTVLSLFALLGLAQLMICLVCILVLVRYRNMIPVMFALLLVHQLGRHVVFYFLPIARTGTPPGPFVNLALLAVMIIGLLLSLRGRETSRA
jgi:hypothetical protein